MSEGGNGVPNNYLDDGEAAFAREFPELEEMLRDEEDKSEDYQHPSSTTFLPFIRTVQRIVLYETKSVSHNEISTVGYPIYSYTKLSYLYTNFIASFLSPHGNLIKMALIQNVANIQGYNIFKHRRL